MKQHILAYNTDTHHHTHVDTSKDMVERKLVKPIENLHSHLLNRKNNTCLYDSDNVLRAEAIPMMYPDTCCDPFKVVCTRAIYLKGHVPHFFTERGHPSMSSMNSLIHSTIILLFIVDDINIRTMESDTGSIFT
jgi:hypothetical protein